MYQRPILNASLDPELFADHYWLKSELLSFCRNNRLPSSGSKTELKDRVHRCLSGLRPLPQTGSGSKVAMPETFSLQTIVGEHWRCSQPLRAFFVRQLGGNFHFDKSMRDLIKSGAGRTLDEIIRDWKSNRVAMTEKPIETQFEYNRFVREYRRCLVAASQKQVSRAWKHYRSTPVSKRLPVETYAASDGEVKECAFSG